MAASAFIPFGCTITEAPLGRSVERSNTATRRPGLREASREAGRESGRSFGAGLESKQVLTWRQVQQRRQRQQQRPAVLPLHLAWR